MDENIPIGRKNHASCTIGTYLLIFGGEAQASYLNDMHIFNYLSMTWSQFAVDVSQITQRTGACMCSSFPYVFIFGGFDVGYRNDLWIIDYNSLTLTQAPALRPTHVLAFQKCFVRVVSGKIYFHAVLGITTSGAINDNILKYSVSENTWEMIFISEIGRNYGDIVQVSEKLLVFGGVRNQKPVSNVLVVNLDDWSTAKISQKINLSAFAAVYYERSLYLLLGAKNSDFDEIFMEKNLGIRKFDLATMPCSLGTFTDGSTCKYCPTGTYSSGFQSVCELCPVGTYGPLHSAISVNQCLPCNSGFFNPNPGSEKCFTCPSNEYCQVGSTQPIISNKPSTSGTQPDAYPNISLSQAFTQSDIIIYSVMGIFTICFILFPKMKSCAGLDYFPEHHNHTEGNPMVLKQNWIGAYFSVILYLLAIRMLLSQYSDFIENNILESKQLLPLVSYELIYFNFYGNITTQCELNGYGGKCIENNKCHSDIAVVSQNIQVLTESVYCEIKESVCKVTHVCKNCEINIGASVKFDFGEQLSYAASFNVFVESTSSIPSQNSSVFMSIFPTAANTVFQGINSSTIIAAIVPSVFVSDDSQWPSENTGYHASGFSLGSLGSTTDAEL